MNRLRKAVSSNKQGVPGHVRFYAFGILIMCLLINRATAQQPLKSVRPRIVVTADPELDDNNSLIRFLLYSSDLQNEFGSLLSKFA